ncbi:unnamed protein product [Caretta caretta]
MDPQDCPCAVARVPALTPASAQIAGAPLAKRLLLLLLPSRMQSLCQELCLQSSSIQELQLLFLK